MRWEYNAKEAKWMSAHLQFSKVTPRQGYRNLPILSITSCRAGGDRY